MRPARRRRDGDWRLVWGVVPVPSLAAWKQWFVGRLVRKGSDRFASTLEVDAHESMNLPTGARASIHELRG